MTALKTGDKIGIASPAGFIRDAEDLRLPLDYLASLGFECVIGKNVYKQDRFMAGTDKERATDIMDFFKNPEIKAIFTTAGGCGSQRILPLLDYDIIKNNPKPIIGLSDNSSLQNGIIAKTGNISYTGFSMKYDFKNGHIDGLVDSSLKTILAGEKQEIKNGQTMIGGTSEGRLLGGCLSTFRSLAGTPYFPDLTNSILLIEDVGEKVHRIDLMLTQIRELTDFHKVKGIIFGTFAACEASDIEDGTVDDAILDFCKNITPIPVIKNFAYGHISSRYILPLGAKVQLDADNCLLKFI